MSQTQQLEIFKHLEPPAAKTGIRLDGLLPPEILSSLSTFAPRPNEAVRGLEISAAGAVNLRHDLFHFVRYVERHGLTRTVRGNSISKSDARRLARILSWAAEGSKVEEFGCGHWSDCVSRIARALGVVHFNLKGIYQGYTSQSESFPDNDITIQTREWQAYLLMTPLEKEAALLNCLIGMTDNEFFNPPSILSGDVFDRHGCAVGPASKMKLPDIRRKLLALLSRLKPDVWYDLRSLLDTIRIHATNLILDRASRDPDFQSQRKLRDWDLRFGRLQNPPPKPEISYEDIYSNFREFPVDKLSGVNYSKKEQITAKTPNSFYRVEGRYLEWFLRETPYLAGFVDLAYRPESDGHGQNISPPLERLKAFRLNRRFFQIMGGAADFDLVKTTVLPTYEILVEAPSYPDVTLDLLSPWTQVVTLNDPVYRLKLSKKQVLDSLSTGTDMPDLHGLLLDLTKSPLPDNVASELSEWCGQADKVALYSRAGLVELGDASRRDQILECLSGLVLDDRLEQFVIVCDPAEAFRRLEQGLHIPVMAGKNDISDRPQAGPGDAPIGGEEGVSEAEKPTTMPSTRRKVSITMTDMVGYHTADTQLLHGLRDLLASEIEHLVLAGDLLIVPASSLSKVRAAIKKLGEQFDVDIK